MLSKKQWKKKLSKMSVSLYRCDSNLKKRILDLLKIHPCPVDYYVDEFHKEDSFNQCRVDWLMGHDSKFNSKVLNMIKFVKQ